VCSAATKVKMSSVVTVSVQFTVTTLKMRVYIMQNIFMYPCKLTRSGKEFLPQKCGAVGCKCKLRIHYRHFAWKIHINICLKALTLSVCMNQITNNMRLLTFNHLHAIYIKALTSDVILSRRRSRSRSFREQNRTELIARFL